MVSSRICALLLSLAVLLAAGSSPAGESEQHLLYGRALKERELGWACYSRHYDASHLRTHPRQNVKDIAMLAYRPDWDGAGASILNFEARFRDGGVPAEFSGECRSTSGGVLACGIECDGGEFSLKSAGGGSLLVDLPKEPGLCDGEDGTNGPGFGSDDRRFRLDRVDIGDCRDLIWDDEIRPRLLKAAGR
ncbi:MAG: hypothetical protein KUL88_05505 [Rhizobium sp.]|nr:hypothetical protein [Rhizobium sp.]